MTVTELKQALDGMGVEYPEKENKAVYEELYANALEGNPEAGEAERETVITSTSEQELDSERKQIERIKQNEQSTILSPDQFDYERTQAANTANLAQKSNKFNFAAGRDSKGRRFFRVLGFNDKRYVYRGAVMDYKDTKVYFFGQAYDALFGHNSKDIITVDGWLLNKGKYLRTIVSKNDISMPVGLDTDEAYKILVAIRKQGDDPSS